VTWGEGRYETERKVMGEGLSLEGGEKVREKRAEICGGEEKPGRKGAGDL
jgi:hypothetical protein